MSARDDRNPRHDPDGAPCPAGRACRRRRTPTGCTMRSMATAPATPPTFVLFSGRTGRIAAYESLSAFDQNGRFRIDFGKVVRLFTTLYSSPPPLFLDRPSGAGCAGANGQRDRVGVQLCENGYQRESKRAVEAGLEVAAETTRSTRAATMTADRVTTGSPLFSGRSPSGPGRTLPRARGPRHWAGPC